MLWPTAVSTERKYERHVERKYGKKKITPNFQSIDMPLVQEVFELDVDAFQKIRNRAAEMKEAQSPKIRQKKSKRKGLDPLTPGCRKEMLSLGHALYNTERQKTEMQV